MSDERAITILDLFSGIGGFALAAEIANGMADAERAERWQDDDTGGCRSPWINGQGEAASGAGECNPPLAYASEQREQREQRDKDGAGRSRHESKPKLGGGSRFRTIAHSEIDAFACEVYHRHFPDSVCLGPVQNVTRDNVIGRCGVLPDVVCGGFPCQPHSCAGKRLASADERDLWDECGRVLRELRPRFALWENVGGLLTSESGLFYNRVLSDLAALRFSCQWQVVPASAVGAPHKRERIWLLCWDELANGSGRGLGELRESSGKNGLVDGRGQELAHDELERSEEQHGQEPASPEYPPPRNLRPAGQHAATRKHGRVTRTGTAA